MVTVAMIVGILALVIAIAIFAALQMALEHRQNMDAWLRHHR